MIVLKKYQSGENVDLLLRGIALSCLTTLSDENRGSIATKMMCRLKNMEVYYFITNNDQIIGTICLNTFKNILAINDFAIFEEYQNKGFGSETLKLLISKKGFYRIQLGVEKRNEKAFKLYKKLGFRINKEDKESYRMEY